MSDYKRPPCIFEDCLSISITFEERSAVGSQLLKQVAVDCPEPSTAVRKAFEGVWCFKWSASVSKRAEPELLWPCAICDATKYGVESACFDVTIMMCRSLEVDV